MYRGSQVTVKTDGNMDVITLVRNGVVLESRRVPMEFLSTGQPATPSRAALEMVRRHPMFGDPFTVSWAGRGFHVVVK